MLLPGNNSTVGKLSQISMLCGQTELLIKERYFNKTRSGYVNSLFFVFCLAQAATRTQSFAIEERRPRPTGLRDVKRGKRRMKKQAETFYQGYETSRPHATSGWRGPFTRLFFLAYKISGRLSWDILPSIRGPLLARMVYFICLFLKMDVTKWRCFKNKSKQITFVFDEAGI